MKYRQLHFGVVDDTLVGQLQRCAPTYDHVGSTISAPADPAVSRYESRLTVGTGQQAFSAARTALRTWRPQRALGAVVLPADVEPDLGATVILRFGLGPARLTVPTRVVVSLDEPNRYGYAYGTLPGHPERGEELFLLEQSATTGEVVLTIRVDAQAAHQLQAFGPVIRRLQRVALRRYVATVAADVRRTGGED